jgi:hypothetical protein
MNSKITIEVDFDNGNNPVIQIIFRKSTDVRDQLVQQFLKNFDNGSSWAKVHWAQRYQDGPEPGHFDRVIITPIKGVDLADESKVMTEQVRLIKKVG